MALITVYHEESGQKAQISERRLDAAKRNGWKPKDHKPEPEPSPDLATTQAHSEGQPLTLDDQENDSWQE